MAYTLTYKLINNGTEYEVTGYTGEPPFNVVIPKEYNALPVTSIGNYAFYFCSTLTSVELPSSVTSIGNSAFSHCENLKSVTIPDGVTSIGASAFYGCSSLTSIVIGDSVTSIGSSAFHNCDSLTSVVIGDSVTSIGTQAFFNCDSLTSVVIGDSVTSIGSAAFSDCSSLTSIIIPDSVTTISYQAFGSCSSLIKVTLLAKTPPSLNGANAFSSNPTLYCFSDAIEKYKTTTNWNTYADNFKVDDIRLYFTMNSRAQKKYFATKEDLDKINIQSGEQISELKTQISELPQADYEQNDETAKDYIKNRPFYEEKLSITWDGVIGDKEVIDTSSMLEGTSIVKVSDRILSYEDLLGTTVIFNDGTQGEITKDIMASKEESTTIGGYGLGGPVISVFDPEKVQATMGITLSTGTYCLYRTDESLYVTSLLLKEDTYIKKIDEKYLPEPLAYDKRDTLIDGTFRFAPIDAGMNEAYAIIPLSKILIDPLNYLNNATIIFNGVEYSNVEFITTEEAGFEGDVVCMSDSTLQNYPFYIGYGTPTADVANNVGIPYGTPALWVYVTDLYPVTYPLTIKNGKLKKLDEKYLPDDLLRTADKEELDSKISAIESTIGDINTALETILGV